MPEGSSSIEERRMRGVRPPPWRPASVPPLPSPCTLPHSAQRRGSPSPALLAARPSPLHSQPIHGSVNRLTCRRPWSSPPAAEAASTSDAPGWSPSTACADAAVPGERAAADATSACGDEGRTGEEAADVDGGTADGDAPRPPVPRLRARSDSSSAIRTLSCRITARISLTLSASHA